MVGIERIVVTDDFEKDVRKMKDRKMKDRVDKEVKKISANPNSGKSLEYGLKGERTVRIKPYRLIYKVEGANLILLRFKHRGDVYD